MIIIPVKCVRIYLNYDDSQAIPYKDIMAELFNVQRQVRAAKNIASSECYMDLLWKANEKQKNGEYPDEEEKYGVKFGQYLYSKIKNAIPDLQTGNVSTIQQSLTKKIKKDSKELLRGDKSISSFKKNQPIEIHNKNIRIDVNEKDICISLSLFGRTKSHSLGLKNGFIRFSVWKVDDGSRAILERCASGEYKHGAGSLVYDEKKKKWRLSLVYSFETSNVPLNPDRICGVDLGIVHPFYCAVNDGYTRLDYPRGRIENFRGQTLKRLHSVQKSMKFASDGSCGHGRYTRLKATNFASGAVARFRDTENDIMSRTIVDFAIKENCGVIQMEDLSGIASNNVFLKSWPYYDLQLKVQQKAETAGIVFRKINPSYTSQRCHKCGYINEENRLSQSEFECKSCGYRGNADYNAAKNIATKDIEKIIGANVKHTA